MEFCIPATQEIFEIPDEWWDFAEMKSFERGSAFYPYAEGRGDREINVVSLNFIEPPQRSVGVPLFKKYKLLPVLFAFQSPECSLPPIEVVPIEGANQMFKVVNGFHRYYGSIAAGYTLVPTVEGWIPN